LEIFSFDPPAPVPRIEVKESLPPKIIANIFSFGYMLLMDYSLLGEVCELVSDRDYYHRRGIFLFYNSIVPSIREKKFFVLRRDGKLIGFCNYAFMTREEIDEATFMNGD
jgi:hypothetical protein